MDTGDWSGEFHLSARGVSGRCTPVRPPTFVAAVLEQLAPRAGERALDLYAGVGPVRRGPSPTRSARTAPVLAVEADARAVRRRPRNLADRPQVGCRRGKVDRALRPLVRQDISADLVVLDPPRTGAGRDGDPRHRRPATARRVAYVACDPAALARDVAYAGTAGYRLGRLRAFDAFPMTHHVECVAILEPTA